MITRTLLTTLPSTSCTRFPAGARASRAGASVLDSQGDEQDAHEKLLIMAGAKEVTTFLDCRRVHRGLITRNVKESVDFFHSRFGMPKFSPALTREFTPYKPSPAPLLRICHVWGVSPAEVMMVGDSAPDDIVCGNRAGAVTCLLDEEDRYHDLPDEHIPTHRIRSLFQLTSLLENSYDLQFVDSASRI